MSSLVSSLSSVKLSKPEKNLLAKLESMGVTIAEVENSVRVNRVSGQSRTLSPVACALFDFVMESYASYLNTRGQFSYNGNKFPVSVWDRTRYLFLKLWVNEYYALID